MISRDMTTEEMRIIADRLAAYFKNEPFKIALWLMTKNPNLGYITPCQLIAIGRGHKVAQFVQDATDGNIE